MNRIRDRSDAWKAFKAQKIKSTPWHTDWSEMARKTVFRRLSKYLPSSTDRMQQAAERIDDDYSFAIDHGDDKPAETKPQAQQPKKRGGAAAALKDVTPQPKQQARQDNEPQSMDDATEMYQDYDRDTGEIIDHDDGRPQAGDDI